ncbi:MAG: hypothetical protein CEN89_87 [Candidatus Berkelbacteria bacterium Licking1014_7]|uniref:DUF4012 domain-containing protein n=1 Tax=Candidatus Berkelbacteria bacterium Licking1014_7 TaxID=2017147 RepID=A0A554LKM7_9BACT|nr:MAG: hypothetical protein CEN89_87 [Candidatus Berkelbacteria bacterium Licking1014_7]
MRKQIDNIYRTSVSPNFGLPITVRIQHPHQEAKKKPARGSFFWFKLLIILVIFFGSITTTFYHKAIASTIDLVKLYDDGKYLMLFQNNTELRPTGGFIGSFATFEINHKKIKNFLVETNIYHQDNEFKSANFVAQPKVLQQWLGEGNSWSLHDSNWEADFERASSDIEWFYETEYQDKINGILAINASALKNILEITGAVKLDDGTMIDSTNVLAEIQQEVEYDYFTNPQNLAVDEPKTIIKELLPKIIEKIRQTSSVKLWSVALDLIERKNILFYFNDNRQSIVKARNWGGKISSDKIHNNYLHINNANLGGGKSSLSVIQQTVYELDEHTVKLSITRTNLERSDKYPTQTNKNYLRVYLPKGAQLENFLINGKVEKINETNLEYEKNVFGFWFDADVGMSKVAQLVIKLPQNIDTQELILQKQSGAENEIYIIKNKGKSIFEGMLGKDELILME